MCPGLSLSRLLDPQSAGNFKILIHRFHQSHIAVIREEIEHPVSARKTAVPVFVRGLHGGGLEDRIARLEIDAHPRL